MVRVMALRLNVKCAAVLIVTTVLCYNFVILLYPLYALREALLAIYRKLGDSNRIK
jgi:hypothetical protein